MFARFSTMFNNVRIPGPGRSRNPPGGARDQFHQNQARASSPSTNKKHCNRSAGGFGNNSSSNANLDQQSCHVDNSQAVIAKIAALYAERLMSDITLVINGVEYPAHRLILCASSDVFQVMLMNPNWCESHESRVVLQESVECAEGFEDFLKYLYTGRLKLELSSVMYLLMLADKYNVKDLIVLCLNYMFLHVPAAASHSQLILWFQYTSNFGHSQHSKVSESCRNYIKWNLELVFKSDDFPHLELELFSSILSEDDLVVYDESGLYTILEYWIHCQIQKFSADDFNFEAKYFRIVNETMQYIRFSMMTPRQLADLIPSPLVRKFSFLMDKMAIAMGFHNGQLENFTEAILQLPHKAKFFTPRLYCTDQWSVCIAAPFDRLQHYQSQTLMFTTPSSFSDGTSDRQVEWCLDFYPKAVQFQKFYLIGWHGTTEMPEHVLKTVRLSVVCRSEEGSDVRVQIGVLIAGYQDGVEHVRRVVKRSYIFSDRDRVLNMDNLLPYGDLNPCASCIKRNQPQEDPMSGSGHSSGDTNQDNLCNSCNVGAGKSSYFVGPSLSSVKIRIVITPMREIYF